MERARATEYRSAFARYCQTCVDTLAYHASLKFGHCSQNMHLQATGRIAFACVDPLRCCDQRCPMCFEFTNELREMLQASPKAIEFVNCQDIDAALPHCCHHRLQCANDIMSRLALEFLKAHLSVSSGRHGFFKSQFQPFLNRS